MLRLSGLARILESTWDAAEGGGGDGSLVRVNRDEFFVLDKRMDNFVKPVIGYPANPPDHAKVKAAYNAYLDELKLAD